MAGTNGIDAATAALIVAAMNGGTAVTFPTPHKVRFNTTQRTANDGADTQWATGGGYTGGTTTAAGATGPTWAAATSGSTGGSQASSSAVTVTNAPAGTWDGCTVFDNVPKATWYAKLATAKTVNAGDTVTVPSGQLTTALG
ncbi:hypothetical protein ALI144C_23455 [Actinosynnema sp. ALI-1.44]|uniref:hypothetical protein n=1 Tax=Actinosynnema sp. ALI-1.44 TaxID=1933779 RepID=UPI00097C06B1|nr:hypothetical protein [Actinosynnema sp. ALI-1.44]ONI79718.1 hypothetical protein ALI144C_23455 [Actinosynnema sp. ALI-1.44]